MKNTQNTTIEPAKDTSEKTVKLAVRTSVRAGAGGSRWHF
jgi:hypothetical protein